jgi:hypothetical protein
MEKSIAGMIGAVAALAVASPSMAAPNDLQAALSARSYADLLQPIPNARALLEQDDVADESDAPVQTVQYQDHHHHHHHHHRRHHRHFRPVVVIPPPQNS